MTKNNKRKRKYFEIWSIGREDIACLFADDEENQPQWPYELSDLQVEAIASRMKRYLEGAMDAYWQSLRDAVGDVVGRTSGRLEDAA